MNIVKPIKLLLNKLIFNKTLQSVKLKSNSSFTDETVYIFRNYT